VTSARRQTSEPDSKKASYEKGTTLIIRRLLAMQPQSEQESPVVGCQYAIIGLVERDEMDMKTACSIME